MLHYPPGGSVRSAYCQYSGTLRSLIRHLSWKKAVNVLIQWSQIFSVNMLSCRKLLHMWDTIRLIKSASFQAQQLQRCGVKHTQDPNKMSPWPVCNPFKLYCWMQAWQHMRISSSQQMHCTTWWWHMPSRKLVCCCSCSAASYSDGENLLSCTLHAIAPAAVVMHARNVTKWHSQYQQQ